MTGQLGPNAADAVLNRLRKHERSNGDSYGVVVHDAEKGIVYKRGTGQSPTGLTMAHDFGLEDVTAAIAHTRLATSGKICTGNAHPIPVVDHSGDEARIEAFMCHNGTWFGAQKAADANGRSDTRQMADWMSELVTDGASVRDAFESVYVTTGQTMLLLERDGTFRATRGSMGLTIDDEEGSVVATTGQSRQLKQGYVYTPPLPDATIEDTTKPVTTTRTVKRSGWSRVSTSKTETKVKDGVDTYDDTDDDTDEGTDTGPVDWERVTIDEETDAWITSEGVIARIFDGDDIKPPDMNTEVAEPAD